MAVEGDFERGTVVTVKSVQGREIARGMVNYSSEETRQIAGKKKFTDRRDIAGQRL
ncbi:PUA domain-containing protein [Syntrophomonas palmitatica]|uniref:PUA domain-containing protein n=1 Tax=Syntrophomonas palmitatica TaxID=402877 RepID=UPI000A420468